MNHPEDRDWDEGHDVVSNEAKDGYDCSRCDAGWDIDGNALTAAAKERCRG